MKFKVIYKSARTAAIELYDQGYYTAGEEYEIYINNNLYKKSNKVIESLYGLSPKSEYNIYIKNSRSVSEKLKIVTKDEFVTLNVRDFGAKGDGINDDTVFIQCAIHSCPKNGRIYIPEGTYKISSLYLKDNIVLELGKGAVLSAFTDRNKFPVLPGIIKCNNEDVEYNLGTWEGNPDDCFSGIICGINVSNVEITGEGIIDGCADYDNWWKNPKNLDIAWRPRLIFLNRCSNITVQGITLKNSPAWNIHPYFSDSLNFIDLTILSPKDSPNTDGLNPESCHHVVIAGVYFSVGDDCIAVKSGKIYMGAKYKCPSENIEVKHCMMKDGHGSITIGSEMAGGVRKLIVRDCQFINTDRGLRIKTRRGRGKDAVVDNIVFENIDMDNIMTPVVINSFYFCDPDGHSHYVQTKEALEIDERTPYIGDLTFKNLNCINCHAAAAYIHGLPEQKIQRVEFENLKIRYSNDPIPGIPAMMDGLKETALMGLFADNVENLILKHVDISGQEGEKYVTGNIGHMVITT